MLKLLVAGAIAVAMTTNAEARKGGAAHHAAAKARTHAMASAPLPSQPAYVDRYFGGPKGYMWRVPAQ